MDFQLTDVEFNHSLTLSAKERYRYSLNKLAFSNYIWGLWREDGWALLEDPVMGMSFPVWTHEKFAFACADLQWKGYRPRPIPVQTWRERWLPGIQKDGLYVAVFPTHRDRGMIISAEKCKKDFDNALGVTK